MAINYPNSLDTTGTTLPDPGSGDYLNSSTAALQHAYQHDTINAIGRALETVVGANAAQAQSLGTSNAYNFGPMTFDTEAHRISYIPPAASIGSWAYVTATGRMYVLFNINRVSGRGWWGLVPSYVSKPNEATLVVNVAVSGAIPNVTGSSPTGYSSSGSIATWSDATFPVDIQPSYLIQTTLNHGATQYWWRVPVSLPSGFSAGNYIVTADVAAATNLQAFSLMNGSQTPFGSNWGSYSSGTPTLLTPSVGGPSSIAPATTGDGQGSPVWGNTAVGGFDSIGAVYSQPVGGWLCNNIPAGATTIYLYFGTIANSGSAAVQNYAILKRIYFNQ